MVVMEDVETGMVLCCILYVCKTEYIMYSRYSRYIWYLQAALCSFGMEIWTSEKCKRMNKSKINGKYLLLNKQTDLRRKYVYLVHRLKLPVELLFHGVVYMCSAYNLIINTYTKKSKSFSFDLYRHKIEWFYEFSYDY